MHDLIQALDLTLSFDTGSRENAHRYIETSRKQPGFHRALLQILHQPGPLPSAVRLQAIIQFKNGVDHQWKIPSTSPNSIPKTEKTECRRLLLDLIHEPDMQVARQVALCIGKVSRIDYDQNWPELAQTLVDSLVFATSHPTLPETVFYLNRSLLALKSVLKCLYSNRLTRGKLLLLQISDLLFPTVHTMYTALLEHVVADMRNIQRAMRPEEQPNGVHQNGSHSPAGLRASFDPSALESLATTVSVVAIAFKCLGRLFLHGSKHLTGPGQLDIFVTGTLSDLETCATLRTEFAMCEGATSVASLLSPLTSVVIAYGKFFRVLLPRTSLETPVAERMLNTYWHILQGAARDVPHFISDSPTAVFPERWLVQACLLCRDLFGDWSSTVDVSDAFLNDFVALMVTCFLPFSEEEVARWSADLEEWIAEEEADRAELYLRPCAESVMAGVLSAHTASVGPLLARMLSETYEASPPDMARKVALYGVFARSPADLVGCIEFSKWLTERIIPEASTPTEDYALLRGRIAVLLANWAEEVDGDSTLATIYSTLVHFMASDPSLSVRLTSATALARCNTWGFSFSVFSPYLEYAVRATLELIATFTVADTTVRLLGTLGVLIDVAKAEIVPYAPILTTTLRGIWEQTLRVPSDDAPRLQLAVIVALQKIVEALGNKCDCVEGDVTAIIACTVVPQRAAEVVAQASPSASPDLAYLHEDVLDLWRALLVHSSAYSPALIELAPFVAQFITGPSLLPRALRIVLSYVLVGGEVLMTNAGPTILRALGGVYCDITDENARIAHEFLNLLMYAVPLRAFSGPLAEAGLFDAMSRIALADLSEPMRVLQVLTTFSYAVLSDDFVFRMLCEHEATLLEINVQAKIVAQMIATFHLIPTASQRKLTALAIGQLISTGEHAMMVQLGACFPLWNTVLGETEESSDGDAHIYETTVFYYFDTPETGDDQCPEAKRYEHLRSKNPGMTINTRKFLQHCLSTVETLCGEALFSEYVGPTQVDPEIKRELILRIEGKLAG